MMLSTFSHTYLLYAFKKNIISALSLDWPWDAWALTFSLWDKGRQDGIKERIMGTPWLGLSTFTAVTQVQSLVEKITSHNSKGQKKKKKERVSMGSDSNSATGWLFCLGQFITSLGICFVFTKTRKPTTVLSNSRAFVRLKDHVYERTLWRFCKSGEMCIQIICLF